MDILRKGNRDPQAGTLRKLLQQHRDATHCSGIFDTNAWQAVRAFRAQDLDRHGQPLVVDGTLYTIERNRRPCVQGLSPGPGWMEKRYGHGHLP